MKWAYIFVINYDPKARKVLLNNKEVDISCYFKTGMFQCKVWKHTLNRIEYELFVLKNCFKKC